MPKPFDATLKELITGYPRDWLARFGLPSGLPVRLIDTDLSTVTALADRVLRVEDMEPWLFHVEMQSGRDPGLNLRLLKYGALLADRHKLPVHLLLVLLRPEADAPDLTGEFRLQPPHGRTWMGIGYEVARIWEHPVSDYLTGGVGTLPLAPLADLSGRALTDVVRHMDARISSEVPSAAAATLWTCSYVLMGLRYRAEVISQVTQGVLKMRESTTYQAILAEGSAAEARKLLLLLGTERFGEPDAGIRKRIEGESGIERLEELARRVLRVASWEELLA